MDMQPEMHIGQDPSKQFRRIYEPVAPDETNRLMMEEFLQNRPADGSWKKSIRILIWSLTTQYCCIIVRPFAAGELLNLTSNWSCTRKDFHPVLQKFNLWRFIVLISDRVSRIFCLFRRITCQGGNWKSLSTKVWQMRISEELNQKLKSQNLTVSHFAKTCLLNPNKVEGAYCRSNNYPNCVPAWNTPRGNKNIKGLKHFLTYIKGCSAFGLLLFLPPYNIVIIQAF